MPCARRDAILVVDDEVLIQFMLEDALEQEGFHVLLAGNAAEASHALKAEATRLLGLVTDIRLGKGATGWEVAERAREVHPALPVIYISGDSRADFFARGVPGSKFLAKPFLAEDVVRLLRALAAMTGTSTRAG